MLGLMKPSEGIWSGGMHFLTHGMGCPCCLRCKIIKVKGKKSALFQMVNTVLSNEECTYSWQVCRYATHDQPYVLDDIFDHLKVHSVKFGALLGDIDIVHKGSFTAPAE